MGNPVDLAPHPTDGTVAVGTRAGQIVIYRIADGARVRTLYLPGALVGVRYSRDGSRLAAVGMSGAVVYARADGAVTHAWRPHQHSAAAMALSSDGELLATIGFDQPPPASPRSPVRDGLLRLWRASDGSMLGQAPVERVAWGTYLQFLEGDARLAVGLTPVTLAQIMANPSQPVAAVSSTAQVAVHRETIAQGDHRLHTASGELAMFGKMAPAVAFSPGGGHFAQATDTVDIYTGLERLAARVPAGGPVNALQFAVEGVLLATLDHGASRATDNPVLEAFRAPSGERLLQVADVATFWAGPGQLSRDGRVLAARLNDGTGLWSWPALVPLGRVRQYSDRMHFRQDGVLMVGGKLYRSDDGLPLGSGGSVFAYSPDGSLAIVQPPSDAHYEVRRSDSGALVSRVEATAVGSWNWLVISSDNRFLAGVGDDGIRVFELSSGQLQKTVPGTVPFAIGSGPLGLRVAAASGDPSAIRGPRKLWRLPEATLIADLPGHAMAFSPDGSLLATGGGDGDGALRLFRADDGSLRETLLGHGVDDARGDGAVPGAIESVSFAMTGHIVTAGHDRTVSVWCPRVP